MPTISFRDLPSPVNVGPGLPRATLVLTIIFLSIGLTALALRVWARFLRKRREGVEDILIYIATPVYLIHAILGILQVVYGGVGTPTVALNDSEVDFSYKLLVATNITYGIILTLSKCSILCLYSRIFRLTWFRLLVNIAIGFNVLWGILAILSEWITCRPVSFAWDKSIPGGTCEHAIQMLLAVGILDVVGDLMIFLLPVPVVKQIQVSKTEKRLLYGLFGIGAVSIFASAVRVTTFSYAVNLDDNQTLAPLVIWTQLEPALSIIVSCGMLLRPVLHKILPRRLFSSQAQEQRGGITSSGYRDIDSKDKRQLPREWTDDSNVSKTPAAIVLQDRGSP